MDTVEVSGRLITALFALSFYLVGAAICYWRLAPRLAPSVKRIAGFVAISHLFIVITNFARSEAWQFGEWLFDMNSEMNLPSAVTVITGLSVAAVLLRTAHFRYVSGFGRWLYYLGMGLFFLLLTWDEHGRVLRFGLLPIVGLIPHRIAYIIVGGSALAAAIYGALTAEKGTRVWHVVMIVGLLLLGTSVIAVDAMGDFCGRIFGAWINGCVRKYVIEETVENFALWLALIAALGHLTYPSATRLPVPRRIGKTLLLTYLVWFAIVAPALYILPINKRRSYSPADVAYTPGQYLHAYEIELLDEEVDVDLILSPARLGFDNLGYSVHLIDQETRESIASKSGDLDHSEQFYLAPGWRPAYRHGLIVPLPKDARRNRILWVALTLWSREGDEYAKKSVSASELALLGNSTVVLGEIVIPADPLGPPEQPALALFENGFTLRPVELAAEAVAGDRLRIVFRWHTAERSRETYIQFLHFFHDETGSYWVYDQHPLGLRLPTRRWWPGLEDEETWDISLPDDLTPGRYSLYTGLYRSDDMQRLSVGAADGAEFADHRIPLGGLLILD